MGRVRQCAQETRCCYGGKEGGCCGILCFDQLCLQTILLYRHTFHFISYSKKGLLLVFFLSFFLSFLVRGLLND